MDAENSSIGRFGVRNYNPLPVMLTKGDGIWLEDTCGRRYIDMLSGYSALSHGHRHPAVMQALLEQAGRLTLTSRAFHHDRLGEFYERLNRLTGKTKFLPMNTGAEAVETAVKAARRWAYQVKGVPEGQAELIVCDNNFHGRTVTMTSLSTESAYRKGFGPFTPGIRSVPFGDIQALEQTIGACTAAFLVEPIQGEAGVVIPPAGYLKAAADLCRKHGVLLLCDEIQTGLGRTGKRFAADWEEVEPDLFILGKALGGGVLPVSVVAGNEDIMDVFDPGSHGSTFGGNPLAAAVGVAAIAVFERERLAERSRRLGTAALHRLQKELGGHPDVRDIRGRGLFIGIELNGPARPYCERLMKEGVLAKETHDRVIRLAPPLVIKGGELKEGLDRLIRVFS